MSFYYDDLKPSEVGHYDLVFVVRCRFNSRSVCARLQVSVWISYILCHPDWPKMELLHVDTCDLKK